MTNSGALRNLITEAADRAGATLAPLSEATQRALRTALDQDDITNPLDTKRTIPTRAIRRLPRCARRCARGRHRPRRGGAAAATTAPSGASPICARSKPCRSAPRSRQGRRGVHALHRQHDRLRPRGAGAGPACADPARYRAHAARHARRWRRPDAPHSVRRACSRRRPTTRRRGRGARAPQRSTGPTALNEVESKALLRAYGIPMPPEHVVKTAAEAEAAAQEIGFPVVLKAVSAALPHKSDAGLVILDVADADGVRNADLRRSTGAPTRSASRSTASWSPSRCPAAPRPCSASSAMRRWDRS